MRHVAENVARVTQYRVAPAALDVHNEADATTVLLPLWIVQPLRLWQYICPVLLLLLLLIMMMFRHSFLVSA